MAQLKGRPRGVPANAIITAVLRFPTLHQAGSQGLSAPEYDLTLPAGALYWNDDATGTLADLPFSGPGDPAPAGEMLLTLSVTVNNRPSSGSLDALPVVDASGVFDLAQPQNLVAWVTSATLEQLIARGNTAAARADTSAGRADTATATVAAAVAAIPGQVTAGLAPVAPALAQVTQALADNAQQGVLLDQAINTALGGNLYARAIQSIPLHLTVFTPGQPERWVFLVDSQGEGADQLNVRDAYPYLVEDAAHALIGNGIQVLNYGLSGRSLPQLNQPEYKGLAAEPANLADGFGPSVTFARTWVRPGVSWYQHAVDVNPTRILLGLQMNGTEGSSGLAADHYAYQLNYLLDRFAVDLPACQIIHVTTMLPSVHEERIGQRQDVTQGLVRVTRAIAHARGQYVVDANRLDGILRRGLDDVSRVPYRVDNWASGWDFGVQIHNGNSLSIVGGFAQTTARDTYNASMSFKVRPNAATDRLWVGLRYVPEVGAEIVVIVHANGGAFGAQGGVELYGLPTGQITATGNLNIPVGAQTGVILSVDDTRITVAVGGVQVIDVNSYVDLLTGFARMGWGGAQGMTVLDLQHTNQVPLSETPSRTEEEILGPYPKRPDTSGNANHPSALGQKIMELPAFDGVLAGLSVAKAYGESAEARRGDVVTVAAFGVPNGNPVADSGEALYYSLLTDAAYPASRIYTANIGGRLYPRDDTVISSATVHLLRPGRVAIYRDGPGQAYFVYATGAGVLGVAPQLVS